MVSMGRDDTYAVGFNPFRKHVTDRTDVILVFAALAVCLALVLWAVLG
jgi:hypothetical protein